MADLKLKMFDVPGRRLINFKLTRGNKEVITRDEIVSELNRIHDGHEAGRLKSTGPVKSNKPTIDIREFVKGLRHD